MSDTQLVAVIVAAPLSSLAVVVGFGFKNSRITDVRDALRREVADTKEVLRAEIGATREVFEAELRAMRAEMAKNHSELLHRFADLDARLTRIEAERRS